MRMTYLFRIIHHHRRLYGSVVIGVIGWLLASRLGVTSVPAPAIVGYDLGAIVYIFWAVHLMFTSTTKEIRRRAIEQDDGSVVVLCLVVLALIFSTSAIFTNLASVKNLEGAGKHLVLALVLVTIIASWFFTNIVFALHYAHDYYFEIQRGRDGGLVFLPADEEPLYFDFLYFSFVIGATAQTADVTLSSRKMRRTCTLQSILAFFFNTALLALTVNVAANLL